MIISLTTLLTTLSSIFRSRAALELENLALRHQIGVLQRSARKRPKWTSADRRLLWIFLSRFWRGWRSALAIIKPETVVAWHHAGFRLFWTWKVRHGQPGRPLISSEVRDLIRKMCRENPCWEKIQGLIEAPWTLSTTVYRSVELSRADTAEVMLCLIDGSSTSMARRTFSFPNDGRATSRQNTTATNALTMLLMRASHGQDITQLALGMRVQKYNRRSREVIRCSFLRQFRAALRLNWVAKNCRMRVAAGAGGSYLEYWPKLFRFPGTTNRDLTTNLCPWARSDLFPHADKGNHPVV
jgi:hypothetical protein